MAEPKAEAAQAPPICPLDIADAPPIRPSNIPLIVVTRITAMHHREWCPSVKHMLQLCDMRDASRKYATLMATIITRDGPHDYGRLIATMDAINTAMYMGIQCVEIAYATERPERNPLANNPRPNPRFE
jgi:hypothetical protein